MFLLSFLLFFPISLPLSFLSFIPLYFLVCKEGRLRGGGGGGGGREEKRDIGYLLYKVTNEKVSDDRRLTRYRWNDGILSVTLFTPLLSLSLTLSLSLYHPPSSLTLIYVIRRVMSLDILRVFMCVCVCVCVCFICIFLCV